jgi:hypothetical protein
VWLGLSQLHTLHDVDLAQVTIGAIAAALPRLHTLTAHWFSGGSVNHNHGDSTSSSASVLFTDLLPRLRVFHFIGSWPVTALAEAIAPTPPPMPLPRLEELMWLERSPQPVVLRGFLRARPIVLHAPSGLIAECLTGDWGWGGAASDPVEGALFSRVCELVISDGTVPLGLSDVARVLRAAPQLRTFRADHPLRGDVSWLTNSAAPLGPALVGLVHPRLQTLGVISMSLGAAPRDVGCVSRLRQICFPRLRTLEVNSEVLFATPEVAAC